MSYSFRHLPVTSHQDTTANFEQLTSELLTASQIQALIPEPSSSSLPLVFNVKERGATGNGSTNDTTACQNAVKAAETSGGGIVWFPAGTYLLSAPLAVPNFVFLEGVGQSSALRVEGEVYAIEAKPANRGGVRNLTLEAATTQVTKGGGIDFTKAAANFKCEDIWLGSNLHTGLNIAPETSGAGIFHFIRVRANGVTGMTNGILAGDGSHAISGLHFWDCALTSTGTTGITNPLTVRNKVDTFYAYDMQVYQGGPCVFGEAGGTGVTSAKFYGGFFDEITSSTFAVSVQNCEQFEFHGVGIDGASGAGLVVGKEATGVLFEGGAVRDCEKVGVTLIAGAKHTTIHGSVVADNNRAKAAFGYGISVAVGTTDFTITSNTIGNGYGSAEGEQRYGINVPKGASNRYIIEQNRLFHNKEAGLVDEGEGAEKSVGRNVTSV